jgi:hypothetical protein
VRLLVLRAAAVCSALSWLVFPGFGVADLWVTWSSEWQVVLEAGWGLFCAVLVGAAFVAVAARPRRCAAALVQLSVATAALALSAPAGAESPLVPLAGLLAVETALVAALALSLPGHQPVRPVVAAPSYPLLVLAVAGAVPWTVYAVAMYRANRAAAPLDVSVGVDHYAVQGALAVALVALALLAALWPRVRRHLGVSTGLAAAYLGLVSLAWPGMAGGYGPVWTALTIAWGAGVTALALTPAWAPMPRSRDSVMGSAE